MTIHVLLKMPDENILQDVRIRWGHIGWTMLKSHHIFNAMTAPLSEPVAYILSLLRFEVWMCEESLQLLSHPPILVRLRARTKPRRQVLFENAQLRGSVLHTAKRMLRCFETQSDILLC